ncbi:MAG: (2Fe-2S) ferredoxin domain-containing protein [Clostridia bacterium]
MKSIAELEAIRKKTQDEMSMRDNNGGMRIIIGMATCGIAAGARPVMRAFLEELKKRNSNIPVNITGCIGVCRLEPMVEVINADGTKVTYVKMTPEKAVKVVNDHIINNMVCKEFTIGSEE